MRSPGSFLNEEWSPWIALVRVWSGGRAGLRFDMRAGYLQTCRSASIQQTEKFAFVFCSPVQLWRK
jgi:hypothetical protein